MPRSEHSCAEKRQLIFHLHCQAQISPTRAGEVMWSLGFRATWAESCEMGTSWPWSWGLTSPWSPWSSSCLIPVCITQQGQPASHFLGHPLGLPAAGNQISLGNTQKPQSQCLKWKSCEKPKLFSVQPSSQAYRVVSGPYSHPLWGSQLLPTSSWPSPGASQGWRSAAQWAGRQPKTTCPFHQCPDTRLSFPTPLIFIIWAGMSLGFLGSFRFDFN